MGIHSCVKRAGVNQSFQTALGGGFRHIVGADHIHGECHLWMRSYDGQIDRRIHPLTGLAYLVVVAHVHHRALVRRPQHFWKRSTSALAPLFVHHLLQWNRIGAAERVVVLERGDGRRPNGPTGSEDDDPA